MDAKRIQNLDLFRFLAIVFVVYFHITERYAGDKLNINFYLWGRFGVDLFFVLSGFLVGGLYYKQSAKVDLFRFWFLRIFRTYPPYIAALLISFLTVYFSRHERFDFGYLIFIQNYYYEIPFFRISWSLCVEEHFYMMFPFFMIFLEKTKMKLNGQLIFWLLIIIIPTLLRWGIGSHTEKFGYYETATHFRLDGIAVGCFLSFLVYRKKYVMHFSPLKQLLTVLFFLGSVAFNLIYRDLFFAYSFGYLFLNISLFFLLAMFYYSNDFYLAKFRIVPHVAAMAYSIYLTHAVMLNLMAALFTKYPVGIYIAYPVTALAIYFTGLVFFRLIEKPTILFRNYYFLPNSVSEVRFARHLDYLRNSKISRFFK